MNADNPYSPPQAEIQVEVIEDQLPAHRWAEIDIYVERAEKGFWTRTIWLGGSSTAMIFYDPTGHGEKLFIDGNLVVTTSAWGWQNVAPRVEFELMTDLGLVPCLLEVRASFFKLLRLTKCDLTIAGQLIYSERKVKS